MRDELIGRDSNLRSVSEAMEERRERRREWNSVKGEDATVNEAKGAKEVKRVKQVKKEESTLQIRTVFGDIRPSSKCAFSSSKE